MERVRMTLSWSCVNSRLDREVANLHSAYLLLLPRIHRDWANKATQCGGDCKGNVYFQNPIRITPLRGRYIPNVYTKPSMRARTLQAQEHCETEYPQQPEDTLLDINYDDYPGILAPDRCPLGVWVSTVDTCFIFQPFSLDESLKFLLRSRLIHI